MSPSSFCTPLPLDGDGRLPGAVSSEDDQDRADPSERHASGRDRPKAFNPFVAVADIPVINITGRIAVTGDELQLVVELQCVSRVCDHAVFVRALDVLHIVAAEDHR